MPPLQAATVLPDRLVIGDASLVRDRPEQHAGITCPLDKKEFSPRLGFAYSWDQKTVIRGGYGVFWIPNYVSFQLNPDNDLINLATTPFFGTINHGLSPNASLDASNCTAVGGGYAAFLASCADAGPFGANGILPPPGRTSYPPASPNISSFAATNGAPTLAPYTNPESRDTFSSTTSTFNVSWGPGSLSMSPMRVRTASIFRSTTRITLPIKFQIHSLPKQLRSTTQVCPNPNQNVTIDQPITNPLNSPNPSLNPVKSPTILAGQLDRPYPQYTNLSLAGYGCCGSTYNSLQATVTRRFQGGGTLLVAYTNAKLLSNTDTLTSWLEGSTGGVGQVQDWNNLAGERSLSSQDVSQRLVISYVLDLPFGHGKAFLNGFSGVTDKLVSGWGIDGVTTFQRGFPLKISWAGPPTSLEQANFGVNNVRPDVVAGCSKGGNRSLTAWFNTACFALPPQWGFGNESRVDSSLRAQGINNFDFAIFKRTMIGERFGLEFRTEFFNLFNHTRFGVPGTASMVPPPATDSDR